MWAHFQQWQFVPKIISLTNWSLVDGSLDEGRVVMIILYGSHDLDSAEEFITLSAHAPEGYSSHLIRIFLRQNQAQVN